MEGPHLDPETYRLLRTGSLAPERARQLADHLGRGCPECEAFLAARPPDALDGATDAALASLAPGAASDAGHDLEFARVRAALRPPRSGAVRALAVAAAVALVAGVSLQVAHQRHAATPSGTGEKGTAAALPVRLRFAVVEGAPGRPRLERGRSGAFLPPTVALAFRAEVGRPAFLALLRVGGGEPEVVWRGRAEHPGAIDVGESGRASIYPLHGLAGPQRFVLVASERRPPDDEELAAAARAAVGPEAMRTDLAPDALTLDVVEVTVR